MLSFPQTEREKKQEKERRKKEDNMGFCGKMQGSLSVESSSQTRKRNAGKSESRRRKQRGKRGINL